MYSHFPSLLLAVTIKTNIRRSLILLSKLRCTLAETFHIPRSEKEIKEISKVRNFYVQVLISFAFHLFMENKCGSFRYDRLGARTAVKRQQLSRIWVDLSHISLLALHRVWCRARAATMDGACISGGTSSGIRRVFLEAVEKSPRKAFEELETRIERCLHVLNS